jgi:hypothetical protein
MTYSILNGNLSTEFLPYGWEPLVKAFTETVTKRILQDKMPDVTDVSFAEKHGRLQVYYSGGNTETDNYVSLLREVSANYCCECGIPSTREKFGVPKCDDCE